MKSMRTEKKNVLSILKNSLLSEKHVKKRKNQRNFELKKRFIFRPFLDLKKHLIFNTKKHC